MSLNVYGLRPKKNIFHTCNRVHRIYIDLIEAIKFHNQCVDTRHKKRLFVYDAGLQINNRIGDNVCENNCFRKQYIASLLPDISISIYIVARRVVTRFQSTSHNAEIVFGTTRNIWIFQHAHGLHKDVLVIYSFFQFKDWLFGLYFDRHQKKAEENRMGDSRTIKSLHDVFALR